MTLTHILSHCHRSHLQVTILDLLSIIIDILLSLSSSLLSAIPKNELVIFLEPQVSFHHWSVGEWANLWLVTAYNDADADRKAIKRGVE